MFHICFNQKLTLMKKITKTIWLTCVAILFMFVGKAQTSCATAISTTYPISLTATTYTSSNYWFTVKLD